MTEKKEKIERSASKSYLARTRTATRVKVKFFARETGVNAVRLPCAIDEARVAGREVHSFGMNGKLALWSHYRCCDAALQQRGHSCRDVLAGSALSNSDLCRL